MFGKLINNQLVQAPTSIVANDCIYTAPISDENYVLLGYKPVVTCAPPPVDGSHWPECSYIEDEAAVTQIWTIRDNPPSVRVTELKALLASTDYQAIKYAEGWISEEDYAPIKAQRQEWRDEINALENE